MKTKNAKQFKNYWSEKLGIFEILGYAQRCKRTNMWARLKNKNWQTTNQKKEDC